MEDNIIACAKHFVAGSEPVNGLNFSPMDLSERTLREIFLPPFTKQKAIGEKLLLIDSMIEKLLKADAN